ncbi:MAG: M14 family metallocarboxypeptidase [Oscillospiraceae bacterium]|nr:M14 family metallocarboxypeptidase [Oscillospiraceae bacterium]
MSESFYKNPPDHESLMEYIRLLRESYRSLKVFPIGKSLLGREITAMCIGNPVGATLMAGAVHGLEWLTCMLLVKFCETLLSALESGGKVSDVDVGRALGSRSLVIIPCLNPDGVEIALRGSDAAGRYKSLVDALTGDPGNIWQANARGVDLNHNFDAGWRLARAMEEEAGITGPSAGRYGGDHPHSEPESIAITTCCLTYQPRTLYAFHSQGEEIYYRYGDNTPERSRMMAQVLASSSGYAVGSPPDMAAHAGLKDWFIEKFRRPGFTVEVGKGKNPLSLDQLPALYRRTEEMMMIAALL